jgi:hypothetical protein
MHFALVYTKNVTQAHSLRTFSLFSGLTNGTFDAFRKEKGKEDQLVIERGVPDPKWFEKEGKPYFQTDFVWTIPFRARAEKQAPPGRCLW